MRSTIHYGGGLTVGDSLNDVTLRLVRHFHMTDGGWDAVLQEQRRGQRVLELVGPQLITIENPARNVLLLRGRHGNPWANAAEFPWIIAGRADVQWLSWYLPRAVEFSDDGRTWRAGYGPRLRHWSGGQAGVAFDQLARVVDLLRAQPDTRQAVIMLWDPLADLAPAYVAGSSAGHDIERRFKDYPCTNWLHFQRVNGALDLTVAMRSNDLFWGFSAVNALNFTLLLQLVAAAADLPVGQYHHVVSNLHVYERHWPALTVMAEEAADPYDEVAATGGFRSLARGLDLGSFTEDCRAAVEYVTTGRAWGQAEYFHWPQVAEGLRHRLGRPAHPWIVEWAYFMLCENLVRYPHYNLEVLQDRLNAIRAPDWRLAATEYVIRRYARRNGLLWAQAERLARNLGFQTPVAHAYAMDGATGDANGHA